MLSSFSRGEMPMTPGPDKVDLRLQVVENPVPHTTRQQYDRERDGHAGDHLLGVQCGIRSGRATRGSSSSPQVIAFA
jgi:hypothetical protein